MADLTGAPARPGDRRRGLQPGVDPAQQVPGGGAISFSAGPRLNSGGSGPVSTVVGNFTGGPFPDLLVTNSQSNDVTLLPGVGQGFFNDQDPRIYSVGTGPGDQLRRQLQRPDRPGDGQRRVQRPDADLRLRGLQTPWPPRSPPAAWTRRRPSISARAAASRTWWWATPATGSWRCSRGAPSGLSLVSAETEPDLPDPTALAFSALTGGTVQFYAATAGRESAELVALSLSIELETGTVDRRGVADVDLAPDVGDGRGVGGIAVLVAAVRGRSARRRHRRPRCNWWRCTRRRCRWWRRY